MTEQIDFTAFSKELLRIEEDCTYSSKGHFNAGIRWNKINFWLGIPAVIISAAAGTAFSKELPDIAAAFSVVGAILTALVTFLKPSEKASSHKTAGDQFLALKNDCRVFREIGMKHEADTQAVLNTVQLLTTRRNELNEATLQVSECDFAKAKKGIEAGEALHVADKV